MRTAVSTATEVMVVERPTRHHRSKQERRRIAEESLREGASVAVVARRHGVNANQVFQWRKLLREGRLDVDARNAQLLPVRISEVEDTPPPQSGIIQIQLGRIRI